MDHLASLWSKLSPFHPRTKHLECPAKWRPIQASTRHAVIRICQGRRVPWRCNRQRNRESQTRCATTINSKQRRCESASNSSNKWKSARRRHKHCTLAVVRQRQKFCPAADPLPGGAGRPKFNQLEMVTTFTYKPSLVRIDARNFELSW